MIIRKKIYFTLFIFICFALSAADQNRNQPLKNRVFILQNDKTILPESQVYTIEEDTFQIKVSGIGKNDGIHIFAYHTDEMFNKYNEPVGPDEVKIFMPGTGMAADPAEEKDGVDLYINTPGNHNYFYDERRKDIDGNAIITVKGIADRYNHFIKTRKAYLIIYVDQNNNGTPEENEVAKIILFVKPASEKSAAKESILSAKTYISTLGASVYVENTSLFQNEYILFKITNMEEGETFREILRRTTVFKGRITPLTIGFNDTENNTYILFSPLTQSLKLQQPYHHTGDNKLIFDVASDETNSGKYISMRIYTVKKENDIFKIFVNFEDSLHEVNPVNLAELYKQVTR